MVVEGHGAARNGDARIKSRSSRFEKADGNPRLLWSFVAWNEFHSLYGGRTSARTIAREADGFESSSHARLYGSAASFGNEQLGRYEGGNGARHQNARLLARAQACGGRSLR